ncbi:MAG: gamma-glutamyltransferase [Leptolyngbyaceae cyanobacterium RU_5_1]|nr:gamma-glutamyltransferase [Leptolyngbyaceae cyanobacterium RU_5_1]
MNFLGYFKRLSISLLVVSVSIALPNPQLAQSAPYLNRGKQGMVASAHALGSEAGLTILQQGGNAVDAAVATTLAISVVEPFSAGIGGGGFLLLRNGKTGAIAALDFRERAPLAATRTMYLDAQGKVRPNASTDGYLAVGVPGTIAGLREVHRQYGRLSWPQVVAPAVRLAADGFVVSPRLAAAIARQKTLQQNPAARQIFTRSGKPLDVGDRLVQADLAKTLRSVAQNPQNFYIGSIAQAIARDMKTNGGLITLQDLKQYRPIWREPVCGTFRAARICSMPPPSSGGVHLLQMLNLIGDMDLKALGWHHPDTLHLLVETMRIAYADRAEYLGDPDFVKVPVAALISPAYAQLRRQEIDPNQARPSSQVRATDRTVLQRFSQTKESGDTSHLSVVDRENNAVSLTFTVNLSFGAGVVTAGTGIVLNNEMDDFAIAPGVPNAFGLVGREANAIDPRKTPLSSMTPTIVTENGQLRLVTGAPGGSTIITTVLQVVLNVLVYEMDVRSAVAAPRVHHQWLPDQLMVEQRGLDTLTLAELRRRGHKITTERGSWGNANAIVRSSDGWLEGAADPRGEGAAYGF